jgi:hypothetical protein
MLLEPPPQALGRHLETLVPRPLDLYNRPARGADESNAPRCEGDAVRGEVDAGGSEVGVEEVLNSCAGLGEVEEVTEGLRLTEVQLGLVRPDVVVHLERDEEIQHGGLAAVVEQRARASASGRGRRGEREGIGGVWWSDERGVGREVGRAQHVHTGYIG